MNPCPASISLCASIVFLAAFTPVAAQVPEGLDVNPKASRDAPVPGFGDSVAPHTPARAELLPVDELVTHRPLAQWCPFCVGRELTVPELHVLNYLTAYFARQQDLIVQLPTYPFVSELGIMESPADYARALHAEMADHLDTESFYDLRVLHLVSAPPEQLIQSVGSPPKLAELYALLSGAAAESGFAIDHIAYGLLEVTSNPGGTKDQMAAVFCFDEVPGGYELRIAIALSSHELRAGST